ncbi:MAG: hypothetical protein IJR66_05240 [Clostridia bacterium]|nr:hypothetical protein [Clostridia bacterium]
MAKNILTPLSVWSDYKAENKFLVEEIERKKSSDLIYESFYFSGKDKIKIFATKICPEKLSMPAILLIGDGSPTDTRLSEMLAEKGYCVLAVDFKGRTDGKPYYTVYPEDKDFANYEKANINEYKITCDIKSTCWYVWGSVVRNALSFLKRQPFVESVGVIGVKEGATPLYNAIAEDNKIDLAVFLFNAGWQSYKGKYDKTATISDILSDEELCFISGVEPQSYAQYIKCPTLLLSPTNSKDYDCDRADDTLERINGRFYTAHYYSANYSSALDSRSYKNILLFLERFAKKNDSIVLPSEPELKLSLEDGEIVGEVKLDGHKEIKYACIYASEEAMETKNRSWEKVFVAKQPEFSFSYRPFYKSEIAFFYCKVIYKNGFSVCSNVISKKFTEKEIKKTNNQKVIFTSRNEIDTNPFVGVNEDGTRYIHFSEKKRVFLKKGPMDIYGVYADGGLITYKIGIKKDNPSEDSILIFDIYLPNDGEISIILKEAETEYSAKIRLSGGQIWHNVKLERNRFKTEEGRILKDFTNIKVLEIKTDNEFLLNNMLWI